MLNLKIFILCCVIGVGCSQSCITDEKNGDDEYFKLSPIRKSTDKNIDKKFQRSLPNLLREMRSGNPDNIKLMIDKVGNVQLRTDPVPDESIENDMPESWHVLQPLVLYKSGNPKLNANKQNTEQRIRDEWASLSSETSEITKSLKSPYDNDEILTNNKPQFKIEKSDGLIILKPINEKPINENSNPIATKRSKNEETSLFENKELDVSALLSLLSRFQETFL